MMNVSIINNAEIRPPISDTFATGGVFVDGKPLRYTLLAPTLCEEMEFEPCSTVVKRKGRALFLGVFYDCWGHHLTDSLRFLWVFLPKYRNLLGDDLANLEFIYVAGTAGQTGLAVNFLLMLKKLGIASNRLMKITEVTEFSDGVVIPEPCFWQDPDWQRHFTPEYNDIIDFLGFDPSAPVRKRIPYRTVYFVRSEWKKNEGRKDFGESSIVCAFRKAWPECEFVSPENLSLQELVALLQSCRRLVSTEGSVSHNAVFLPKGSEVIILRKCTFNNRYQKAINEARELKCTYLKAYLFNHLEDKNNPVTGPFFLCVTREIAEFLGCGKGFSLKERVLYEVVFFKRIIVKARRRIGRLADVAKRIIRKGVH